MNRIEINKQVPPAKQGPKKVAGEEQKNYFQALQWARGLQQKNTGQVKQDENTEKVKNPEKATLDSTEEAAASAAVMLQLLGGRTYNQSMQQVVVLEPVTSQLAASQPAAVTGQMLPENAVSQDAVASYPVKAVLEPQLAQNALDAAKPTLQQQTATTALNQSPVLQQQVAKVASAANFALKQPQTLSPEVASSLATKIQQQAASANGKVTAQPVIKPSGERVSAALAAKEVPVALQIQQEPQVVAANQQNPQLAEKADALPGKFIQQALTNQPTTQLTEAKTLPVELQKSKESEELLVLQAEQQRFKIGDGPVVIKVAESLETEQTSAALAEKLAARLSISRAGKQSGFILQLNPENLGKVQVEMLLQNGKALVEIVCEGAKAKQLLGNTVGELQSILANRTGLEVQVIVAEKAALPQQQATEQDGKNQQPREQQQRRHERGEEEQMSFLEQLRLRGQLIE